MNPIELAREAAVAAAEKKAARPVLLDLRGLSDICDFQFICSGQTDRQTQAIAKGIEDRCRQSGIKPFAIEGQQNGNWILLDYGATLVHIFLENLRDYYSLESLWTKAKFIDLKQFTKS